jgi:hypothetical protein
VKTVRTRNASFSQSSDCSSLRTRHSTPARRSSSASPDRQFLTASQRRSCATVDAALPLQKALVDEIPPQRSMIVVERRQKLVDLCFGVWPVCVEAARDVLEDHAPLSPSCGQAPQATVLDEVAEHALLIGRPVRQITLARRAIPRCGPERFERHV